MENTISSPTNFINTINKIPRLSLGEFPTPIKKISLDNGSYFWLKDDGLSSSLYGGNKVRKLEYLLAQANQGRAKRLIAYGDYNSHNLLACALFGKKLGFDLDIITFPSPDGFNDESSLAIYKKLNANIVLTKNIITASMHALRLNKKESYLIPLGSSSVLSTLGYVKAGLELSKQIQKGILQPPKKIYVALGTAGTVAGLLVGLSLAEASSQVVAVRTVESVIANKFNLSKLVFGILKLLQLPKSFHKTVLARLECIDGNWLGKGYGHSTSESQEAIELMIKKDVNLELVFTGKTMAAMLNRLSEYPNGELLFWNTHSRVKEDQS